MESVTAATASRSCDPARPHVTIALLSYNRRGFIRNAVASVLQQEYQSLEIILSDDNSQDGTFEIICAEVEKYQGSHQVIVSRNEANLGLASHVNKVMKMASGDIILFAHDDDISLPNRASKTVALFQKYPQAMAISFSDDRIDGAGSIILHGAVSQTDRVIDLETFLATGPRAQSILDLSAASRAIRKKVYDVFGDLSPDTPGEDSPYVLRCLYLGTIVVSQEAGILYRCHAAQMSGDATTTKMKFENFMSQYRRDLGHAIGLGLISARSVKRVQRYAAERLATFKLRKFRFLKSVPDFQTVATVLGSPHYALREKLGLCKRFLLRQPLG
jgi:glycosyltransferase involved in cell wall biosynthesis